ncbi:hypothetical protein HW555_001335 [Spodoptera exigua]|uniref:Uncharacterized protein n=1 Tax=Spodoptera exigua TaxID=7107 RepID=A0A835LAK1_SPOEX|nr:hypothetical protein HW555_001335 [Spodoptera exigua]
MGYCSVVVSVLALLALATAEPSIRDNSLDGGERVLLVSPVLAPPRDSRIHDTTRSRQFPILVLLAQANPSYGRLEPEAKSLKGNLQPIYVKKLEDQDKPENLNRQKRHLLAKKLLGLGGGGGGLAFENANFVVLSEITDNIEAK